MLRPAEENNTFGMAGGSGLPPESLNLAVRDYAGHRRRSSLDRMIPRPRGAKGQRSFLAGFAARVFVVSCLGAGAASGQQPPALQLQGQPYSGGAMTLHLTAAVGQPTLLLYGLNPLDPPVQTTKGPFYVGTVFNIVFSGTVPPAGRIDIPFVMPPLDPIFVGIPMVMQGLAPGSLTNPATLPLDQPYLAPAEAQVVFSPNPTDRAIFGRTVGVGDFNGDGFGDIVGCAEGEDDQGIQSSGAAYVMWGPDYSTSTALHSELPHPYGFFGAGMAVGRLDGDELDDLIIGETAGSPPVPGLPGKLYVYRGSELASGVPWLVLPSPGTGLIYTGYGHAITIGDYNGDGDNDIAVSLNKATVQGLAEAGRIEILLGPSFTAKVLIPNPTPVAGDGFGSALRTEDVNRDGIDDLIESSGADSVGGVPSIGSFHVFLGPNMDLATKVECPIPAGPVTAFGIHLGSGDLNGDGFPEVLVDDNKDRVFVYWGPDYADYQLIRKPPSLYENPFGESDFGSWVAAADMNGDGHGDLLIGDPFDGPLEGCAVTAGGTVFVALGPYFATFCRASDLLPVCSNYLGERCAIADLDGDGAMELVAGVPGADDFGINNCGHITVLHGAAP